MEALARANRGHAGAYGHDELTRSTERKIEHEFGPGSSAFLVFNGSAANVLSLRAACRPWEGVVCADTAHVHNDEAGAPERIAGVKLLPVPSQDGKLTPAAAARQVERTGDEHAVQPRVLTISQSTELGTVYTPDELRALAELAHEHGLVLHIDGARLSNAAAALAVSLSEASTGSGADIVSFGGTKNGLLGGEAVVFAGAPDGSTAPLVEGFLHLRKQTLQLASKMRFLAAQFDAYLNNELWRRNAAQANAMAARLADAVRDVAGVRITRPVQANVVFAELAPEATRELQTKFPFHVWDRSTGEVRWMCAWDTTEDDVDAFAAAIASV
jgi:threonine aldolase